MDKVSIFYTSIGKLSIRFAVLEQNLKTILNLLMHQNQLNELLSLTLIDEYSLSKTCMTLDKITKIELTFETQINSLIKAVEKLRKDRNLFIHGLWHEPILNKNNEIEIICDSTKLKNFKTKIGHSWTTKSSETFTLKQINHKIKRVEQIITYQFKLIRNMEKHYF